MITLISPFIKLIFEKRLERDFREIFDGFFKFDYNNFEEFLKYDYNNNPENLLRVLLEDFIKFHSQYPDEGGIKKEIYLTLLKLLPLNKGIARNSIYYRTLSNISTIHFEDKEDIIQLMFESLKDSKMEIQIRVILFETIGKYYFNEKFEFFQNLLRDDNLKTPLKLKTAILNRLSKENPKYSSILRKANIELINLYKKGENH